jgi:hypothetical protein
MEFKGVIIKESLKDDSVLKEIKIIKKISEKVTEKHRTPWLTEWNSFFVEIPEEKIDEISEKLRISLDDTHEWYIDLANNKYEITIFHDIVNKRRVFKYFK